MKNKKNKKNQIIKNLVVVLIVLFLLVTIVSSNEGKIIEKNNVEENFVSFDGNNSGGNNFYVGGTGPDNYTSIQDAIDDASDGDKIFVYNTSSPYYENIVIDNSITLIGDNMDTTIIDGGKHGDVVNILANGIRISGFTIRNGGNGIRLWHSSRNNITDNNISNNGCGIMQMEASYNTIFGNIICNSGYGIYAYWYSNNNIITYNNISNNDYSIIFVDSNNNDLFGNIISNNTYGINFHSSSNTLILANIISNTVYGIVFCNSREIKLANNDILNNEYGIYSYCSIYNNVITYNNIQNNDYGIYLDRYSNSNIITFNTISYNHYGITIAFSGSKNTMNRNTINNNDYGIYIWDSGNNIILGDKESIGILNSSVSNTIYHNNFINNTQDAYDECINSWDNGYIYGGNYWYVHLREQTHFDKDGIYDKSYNITGGDNKDFYPLVYRFELYYMLTFNGPTEIDEDTDFSVTVKSLGGTVIPNALVELGGEVKFTDNNGMAQLTAPEVTEDTLFWINVTKQDYTSVSEVILVKNLPERKLTIILGKITNLKTEGDFTKFEAVNLRFVTFLPLNFYHNTSRELITTSKYYFGILKPDFIFAVTLIYLFPL